MISTFIKYKLIDKCIDQLFSVSTQLITPFIDEFYIGHRFIYFTIDDYVDPITEESYNVISANKSCSYGCIVDMYSDAITVTFKHMYRSMTFKNESDMKRFIHDYNITHDGWYAAIELCTTDGGYKCHYHIESTAKRFVCLKSKVSSVLWVEQVAK